MTVLEVAYNTVHPLPLALRKRQGSKGLADGYLALRAWLS